MALAMAAVPQAEVVVPLGKAISPRARRRRDKRRRIRTVRPTDPKDLRTKSWYHSPKRKGEVHHHEDPRPAFVDRVHRREIDGVEPDEAKPFAAATTVLAVNDALEESDVLLEETPTADEPIAVVVVPANDVEAIYEIIDETTSEIEDLFAVEETEEFAAGLPAGFHLVNGGGAYSHMLEVGELERAAVIEPDWGDPEAWDALRIETLPLVITR